MVSLLGFHVFPPFVMRALSSNEYQCPRTNPCIAAVGLKLSGLHHFRLTVAEKHFLGAAPQGRERLTLVRSHSVPFLADQMSLKDICFFRNSSLSFGAHVFPIFDA